MGISRSLTIGSSSLRAHQARMDVISNNIANSNTTGFKSSRATFIDQFNQTVNWGKPPDSEGGNGIGGIDPKQYGLGVKMGSISMDMAQGVIETTDRPMDLAIEGDGFFVYNFNGKQVYSRAGAISRDRDGYLVDSSTGAYLQGYNLEVDSNGTVQKDSNYVNILNRKVENLLIPPDAISAPKQSQNIYLSGNLNSSMAAGADRKTSIQVFDMQGGSHTLGLTFTKTANANEYEMTAKIDGNDIPDSINPLKVTITFNNDGTLKTPLTTSITASVLNTTMGSTLFDAATPKDLVINLASTDNLLGGLTQFSGPNTATAMEQDGYQTGDLLNLSVDQKGKIWGSFTNGQSEIMGQVIISKFTNPQGLHKDGNSFFLTSPNSGLPNFGTAGEVFESTKIDSGALEQSNVDMTEQFTDMIATQRAFEASARTITVTDQMLGEINILKR